MKTRCARLGPRDGRTWFKPSLAIRKETKLCLPIASANGKPGPVPTAAKRTGRAPLPFNEIDIMGRDVRYNRLNARNRDTELLNIRPKRPQKLTLSLPHVRSSFKPSVRYVSALKTWGLRCTYPPTFFSFASWWQGRAGCCVSCSTRPGRWVRGSWRSKHNIMRATSRADWCEMREVSRHWLGLGPF